MKDKTYNGYKNYETWNVALWIDNDQGLQDMVNEMAKDASLGPNCNALTGKDNTVYTFSETLKAFIEEMQPDLGASMWADLLNSAMADVCWMELAELYLNNVKENA